MKLHVLALSAALCAGAAHAAPIDWNTWSSTSAGSISTTGGPIGVTYSGPALAVYNPYPSYTPTPTFADGVIVDNAPTSSNGILQITGGDSSVQTLTFSQAVVDPVMAIWSLGQGGINASFHFLGSAVPTCRIRWHAHHRVRAGRVRPRRQRHGAVQGDLHQHLLDESDLRVLVRFRRGCGRRRACRARARDLCADARRPGRHRLRGPSPPRLTTHGHAHQGAFGPLFVFTHNNHGSDAPRLSRSRHPAPARCLQRP